MKFYIKPIFFTLLIFAFTTCKNKLNINAPYKEIPSIYAVLNPQEDIQIIRVNKVFLGEGNANDMAKIADSINYKAGDLLITLERYVNGVKTIASKSNNLVVTFHDSVIMANPGVFNTTQRVYVSGEKLFNTGEYRLTVKNTKSEKDNIFTAKANAVDTIRQDPFTTFTPTFYPVAAGSATNAYIDYGSYKTGVLSFTYKIPNFANNNLNIINQVKMRIHFYDSLFDNTKIPQSMDYNFSAQLSKNAPKVGNTALIGRLDLTFRSIELFNAFGVELSKMALSNSILGRRVYKIQYFIYSSTQEYSDYLDYTKPSLSLAQQKPLYSNFDDQAAIGIFTFRSTTTFEKETANPFENDFAYNKNTCGYKFYVYNNPSWSTPTCP